MKFQTPLLNGRTPFFKVRGIKIISLQNISIREYLWFNNKTNRIISFRSNMCLCRRLAFLEFKHELMQACHAFKHEFVLRDVSPYSVFKLKFVQLCRDA